MSHDENSPGDGNMSQEAMNESEVESDNFSENGEDDELTDDKFDPQDRAYFEKLKQQEREEREEIEMELKLKQQEFEVYTRQGEDMLRQRSAAEEIIRLQAEDMRAREKEIRAAQERMHQREQEMLRGKHVVSAEDFRSAASALPRSLPSPLIPQPLTVPPRSSPKTDPFPKTEFKPEIRGGADLPGQGDFPKSEPSFKRDFRGEFKSSSSSSTGGGGENHSAPLIPADAKSSSPFSSPPSPDRGFPRPSQAPSTGSLHSDSGSDSRTHHWTFEEQFKQLYELSEDPKRKEFLDDLFSFMQKRGSPVNRIPIMAKQTLDLYELFRLVVSKGGLVEVINKKLWREITKGLNLPSSITSAAFTLRTQYMKYLYPYECDKLKLSSPQELQAAIDGNRREGRRSSYGYDLSPGGPPTMIPTSHHLNGALLNGKLGNSSPDRCNLLDYMIDHGPLNLRKSCTSPRLNHVGGDDDSLPPTPALHPAHHPHHPHLPPPRVMSERDALAMEAASRAMEEATRKMDAATRPSPVDDGPTRKRFFSEEERLMAHAGMPSAHLKITSRNDGRSEIDNSLVVSMEINGIMFQGVLFAQPRRV